MMDSPCHHCPKCPCKSHDFCGAYQEYRNNIIENNRKKIPNRMVTDTIIRGVEKCKKWRHKK